MLYRKIPDNTVCIIEKYGISTTIYLLLHSKKKYSNQYKKYGNGVKIYRKPVIERSLYYDIIRKPGKAILINPYI